LSKSWVLSEKGHLGLADRPSHGSAKLVPLERWYLGRVWSIGDVEEVPGIQSVVAQILEDGSTPLVRPRRRHDGHLCPGTFSIFGTIRLPEHVAFPHVHYADP